MLTFLQLLPEFFCRPYIVSVKFQKRFIKKWLWVVTTFHVKILASICKSYLLTMLHSRKIQRTFFRKNDIQWWHTFMLTFVQQHPDLFCWPALSQENLKNILKKNWSQWWHISMLTILHRQPECIRWPNIIPGKF